MRKQSQLLGVVPSTAFGAAHFEVMPLHGAWADLLGKVSPNFSALIHGKPGQGKSTFCYVLAGYLALHHGTVLYIAAEEQNGYTVKEKIERLGVAHPDLRFADSMATAQRTRAIQTHDFIIVDSLNTAGMGVAEVRKFIETYNNKGLVFVSQSTKSGQARGSLELQHDVDIVLKAEGGFIKNEKNRFGGNGTLRVY